MLDGQLLTLWTIRIAALCYFAAVLILLRDGASRRARLGWTAGCGFYLAHVAAAFQFHHAWSHHAAYSETARQSREAFGFDSGVGLYVNYAFTAVWIADAAWWWLAPAGHSARRRLTSVAIHAFMAFMFFNGAVVFAAGPTRWAGLVATAIIVASLAVRARAASTPYRASGRT